MTMVRINSTSSVALASIMKLEASSRSDHTIVTLTDGSTLVADTAYSELVRSLGPIIPNTTACVGATLCMDEDDAGACLHKVPIIAWRIEDGSTTAIDAEGEEPHWVIYPDGQVKSLFHTFANLAEAARAWEEQEGKPLRL